MPFAYLFEEAKGLDKSVLGGKGYGLVQMVSIGLRVPPGIVISTAACREYYNTGAVPKRLFDEVAAKVSRLEKETGKKLGGRDAPLLVSVRSGAPFSMPGMMDTILNLGLNDEVVQRLAELTRDERFAYDAYRRFLQMFGKTALGIDGADFEAILGTSKKRAGMERDSQLSAADLRALVGEFKDLIKAKGAEFPQDPWKQLQTAIVAVFRSWENPRAKEYRRYYRIPDDIGTAVNVQAMVFGNMGDDSGSGVGFTRDPSTGEKRLFGEYLSNAQGEDVVAGTRTPVGIESLGNQLKEQLQQVARTLEKHFRDMQDFEFTVEKGRLYLLQTRNGKRTAQAAVKIAVEMVGEGLIRKEDAVARIDPDDAERLLHRTIDPKALVSPIAKGLNASPGATWGKVVLDTDEAANLGGKGERVILVRPETTPEDIRGVIASQGVLTARGGMTSHAAVVARGMGKPAVVGAGGLRLHPAEGYFETETGTKVKKGDVITLDGTSGTVMLGEVPTVEPQLTDEFRALLGWADELRRLGVYANADTPEAARRAREFGAEGIGLCRTERMFNAPDRLRIMQDMISAETMEAKSAALRKLIPFQLNDFRGIFKEMTGKPVVVRLLDLPLHEFLPEEPRLLEEIASMKNAGQEGPELQRREKLLTKVRQLSEHNPMLGHRGCRLAVTFPEMYDVQVEAIIRAAVEVRRANKETAQVFIMLPLVSEVEEVIFLKKVVDAAAERTMKELGERIEYRVGTMIETPRAALTAAEIAKHAEFFSFGTNDLTQATFAFSRDDVEAKFMAKYLEERILPESPFEVLDATGVGKLVEMAVTEGRKTRPGLEVGICGEHGGEPRSIAFFDKAGLDYVSCSGFRVPVARLAAAQATVASGKPSSTV